MRSSAQNRLYHELCSQLYTSKPIQVWDGRFEAYGLRNPMIFRPSAFSYDGFRDIIKSLDFEYPRDDKNKLPLSSAKLSTNDMNSHITFLEVLLMEDRQLERKVFGNAIQQTGCETWYEIKNTAQCH